MSLDTVPTPSSQSIASASPASPAPSEPSSDAASATGQPGAGTPRRHIRLTSHSGGFGALPIHWGAASAAERGPIVGTTTKRAHRNVIGTHSGSYSVYRALAVAAGALSPQHKADLTNTAPTDAIGPYP